MGVAPSVTATPEGSAGWRVPTRKQMGWCQAASLPVCDLVTVTLLFDVDLLQLFSSLLLTSSLPLINHDYLVSLFSAELSSQPHGKTSVSVTLNVEIILS